MKYIIDLTEKQKAQMDCMMEIVHRYVGFNPKLEPIDENTKDHQGYYNKGYNSAINDYNGMIQWLHDCTDDFKEFMNKKYGYDIMYLTNPKGDEGVMLYDLICDHDIAEVISEFKKWQEEKSIKVGDEVITNVGDLAIVLRIDSDRFCVFYDDGLIDEPIKTNCKKTGRHFEEITQLLDKLRGK